MKIINSFRYHKSLYTVCIGIQISNRSLSSWIRFLRDMHANLDFPSARKLAMANNSVAPESGGSERWEERKVRVELRYRRPPSRECDLRNALDARIQGGTAGRQAALRTKSFSMLLHIAMRTQSTTGRLDLDPVQRRQ